MDSKRVLVFALLIGVAASSCSRATKSGENPTAEAKAYVRNLQLSGVTMKATESYAQQVVTEIEGKVTNTGSRTVEVAEVACIFYDSIGQMILREQAAIVKRELRPGDTRTFRLPFDDIPASWNNRMPQLVIAKIRLS